ncbi:MAG TPA: hypothetical protein VM344_09075 [Vitreimonas sp.]|nr:hypothetical protein [Vitreimonas sp.]
MTIDPSADPRASGVMGGPWPICRPLVSAKAAAPRASRSGAPDASVNTRATPRIGAL